MSLFIRALNFGFLKPLRRATQFLRFGRARIIRDTNEITDAMQAIANDVGLRSQLSQLGLQRATQFSWEKTGQATAEVLQRFL